MSMRTSPHLGSGRRERRKSATRRELLRAGRALFGAVGLYDARIEDLTQTAGIAKGTLYGYFADKEELIVAVVAAIHDDLLAWVRQALRGTRGTPARRRLLEDALLSFFASHPADLRVLHQMRGFVLFRRPPWRQVRESLIRVLDALADALGPNPAKPSRRRAARAEAARLYGVLSGIASARATPRRG